MGKKRRQREAVAVQNAAPAKQFSPQQVERFQDLVNNAMMFRQDFVNMILDPRRDLNAECGYPATGEMTPEKYYRLFEREPLANRVCELMPKECWQLTPTVYEDEDADTITEFEEAWDSLDANLRGDHSYYEPEEGSLIWDYLERLDILSGIATFGVLLMGFDDGKMLQDPVDGVIPDGFVKDITGVSSATVMDITGPQFSSTQTGANAPFQIRVQDGKVAPPDTKLGVPRSGGLGAMATEGAGTAAGQPDAKDRSGPADDKDQVGPQAQGQPQKPDPRDGQLHLPILDPMELPDIEKPTGEPNKQWTSPPYLGASAVAKGPDDKPSPSSGKQMKTLPQQGEYTDPAEQRQLPGGVQTQMDDRSPAYVTKDIYGGTTQVPPQGGLSSTMGTDAQYRGTQFSPETPVGLRGKRRLIFLRPYPEYLVQVVQYEADIRNPRFGQPVMYLITLNDPHQQHTGVGLPLATVRVHWSRVIHAADNLMASEIFGLPRMLPVLNPILDAQKVRGGSAEMYWRGAFPGFSLETHPQLGGDVSIDQQGLRDMMENWMNGMQRYLALMGMSAKSLAPQVSDPTAQIDKQIEAICIKLGCPIRVFKGAERGELASSQDDEDWNDRVRARRINYITPRIIVPFIDRLITVGVLPIPKGPQGVPGNTPPDQRGSYSDSNGTSLGDPGNGASGIARGRGIGGAGGADPLKQKGGNKAPELPKGLGDRISLPPTVTGRVGSQGKANDGSTRSPMTNQRARILYQQVYVRNDNNQIIGMGKRPVAVETNGGYTVSWPDKDSVSKKDKAMIALQLTQALAAYISGQGETVLPLEEYLTRVWGYTEEEALSLTEAAKKQAAQQQVQDEQTAEEHGMLPTPPPGFEHPPQQMGPDWSPLPPPTPGSKPLQHPGMGGGMGGANEFPTPGGKFGVSPDGGSPLPAKPGGSASPASKPPNPFKATANVEGAEVPLTVMEESEDMQRPIHIHITNMITPPASLTPDVYNLLPPSPPADITFAPTINTPAAPDVDVTVEAPNVNATFVAPAQPAREVKLQLDKKGRPIGAVVQNKEEEDEK